jgi:hypothetical protein
LTREEKQLEIERHRRLILATLDYLILTQSGSFVLDDKDEIADHFENQKPQVEKYFQQRRLDRLQQRFAHLTEGIRARVDEDYCDHVKTKTGYEIDLVKDLRARVDLIVEQARIRRQSELSDVSSLLQYYQRTADTERVNTLKKLNTEYVTSVKNKSSEKQNVHTEVLSREVEDGLEVASLSFSTGPVPDKYVEQVALSPDGACRVRVGQWSRGGSASTSVSIHFANGASGPVYGTNGMRDDVTATWKDNATIVIHTKRNETPSLRHHKVRSFDDVITIEYIENMGQQAGL